MDSSVTLNPESPFMRSGESLKKRFPFYVTQEGTSWAIQYSTEGIRAQMALPLNHDLRKPASLRSTLSWTESRTRSLCVPHPQPPAGRAGRPQAAPWGPASAHQEPEDGARASEGPSGLATRTALILLGSVMNCCFCAEGKAQGGPIWRPVVHLRPACAPWVHHGRKSPAKPNAKAGAGQSMAPASFLPVTHKVISTAPTGRAKGQ